MSRCVAHRCPDEAVPGKQLCKVHMLRLEAGGGLPLAGEPVKGDPSGHGRYGVVDTDERGVLCHECGERFSQLGRHITQGHGIEIEQYRAAHAVTGSLAVGPDHPLHGCRRCTRCGRAATRPKKICAACRWELDEAAASRPLPRPRWRDLTDDESRALHGADPASLPVLVEALQLDRVPSRAIGQALGLSQQVMARQFPRPEWPRARGER